MYVGLCITIFIYCLYVVFDYTYIDINALAHGIKSFLDSQVWFQAVAWAQSYGTDVCMYLCVYVCMYYVCMYVYMYVSMCVCMNVCMYVCMYVIIYLNYNKQQIIFPYKLNYK